MKKIFHILTAALLLLTGCTNDDTAIDNNTAKTVTFTATLAPKGDATTRAITANNQGTANETLTTAWAAGEKIALYYQTSSGYAKTEATVGTPNGDGSAPITATLDNAIDGGTVKFVYPASLANDTGDDIDESKLLNNQNGRLNGNYAYTISKRFDAATGSGKISVGAGTAVTSERIALTNRVCICKFNLGLSNYIQGVNEYVITIAFAGSHTYTITRNKDFLSNLYVAMLPETSSACSITAVGYASDPSISTPLSTHFAYISDVTLAAGKFYRNVPVMLNESNKTLTATTGELTLQNNDMLSGTGGANTRLKIAAGATVTLIGLTNTGITQNENIPGIECLGDATIILAGENSITGREYAPGIFVPEGKTLTIKGSGTLVATGGNTGVTVSGNGNIGGAGIGGTKDVSCGNIVIAGGTITATGTGNCAGMGSGEADGANITCGDITISGGTVTATGGSEAAGIGSGNSDQASNTCGDITISGGMVTATGGSKAAGIGSGNSDQASNTCGDITISGGMVTATGGSEAAGIGSGYGHDDYDQYSHIHHYYVSACGAISIVGGTVTAQGGNDGAGIGSGWYGRFTSINIGSGITCVTATRSDNSSNVPIGKGFEDLGSGAVTIDGQTLSDAQTQGTATLPTFPNLQVVKSDGGGFTNKTWTLTPASTQ